MVHPEVVKRVAQLCELCAKWHDAEVHTEVLDRFGKLLSLRVEALAWGRGGKRLRGAGN